MSTSRYARFWQQLEEIEVQHGRRPAVWPPGASQHNDIKPRYVYEPDRLLCRRSDIDRVVPGLPAFKQWRPFKDHLAVIELHPGANVEDQCAMARSADKANNNGVEKADLVTPIHWVSITPVDLCPADEPVPPPPGTAVPWPRLNTAGSVGQDVTVVVIDTGVYPCFREGHDWLWAVVEPDLLDYQEPIRGGPVIIDGVRIWPKAKEDIYGPLPVDKQGHIKQYAGHGVFCAGVLAAAAPGAKIQIVKLLEHAGALPETEFGDKLLEILDRVGWPQIISLSAGVATMNGQKLVGLEKFIKELSECHPETLLVAAAGNDAERDDVGNDKYHFQPAAHSYLENHSVISVGALRETVDERACFTNHGTSVTVYARGENHVNAFLKGPYIYRHDGTGPCHNHDPALYCHCTCTTGRKRGSEGRFSGMARWSGTSFATPLVAGMIARHLAEHPGMDSRAAAADLISRQAKEIEDPYTPGEKIRVLR